MSIREMPFAGRKGVSHGDPQILLLFLRGVRWCENNFAILIFVSIKSGPSWLWSSTSDFLAYFWARFLSSKFFIGFQMSHRLFTIYMVSEFQFIESGFKIRYLVSLLDFEN